jgi:hypothetical protein
MRPAWAAWVGLLAGAAAPNDEFDVLPPPRVAAVSRQVLQRGATADLVITGERLGGATGVHFSGDGKITASIGPEAKADRLTARVVVAPDAALDERELRVVAPNGVSNPIPLSVGLLPVVEEREPNAAGAEAQRLELPAVVLGAVRAAAEVDAFRFSARQGERLVFQARAMRIGSPLDPVLTIRDATGRELARNDDAVGLDPFLEFDPPADGDFVVFLRDSQFKGSPGHVYHLEAGPVPVLASIFPLGGQQGRSVEVALFGSNLEPGAKLMLTLEPDALGTREVRAPSPLGPSNPRLFEVGTLPEFVETEPNDAPAAANTVTPPVVVNGRIEKPRDEDLFGFTAGDQARLICSVNANRLGSALDALLTLTDAAGNVLAVNDDAVGADASIDYGNFVKGQAYVLKVRDLTYRGGQNFGYRLTVQPPVAPRPDFSVRFVPDVLSVGRGSRSGVWCEVRRAGGFAGDVALRFEGLPPGVTLEPAQMPGNRASSGLFVLSAAADAPAGSFPVRLVAEATIGGKPAARAGEPELANRGVAQAFVTVRDAPPFTVDVIGSASEEELERTQAELAELEPKLSVSTPELEAAQAAWEQEARGASSWHVLQPVKATSTDRVELRPQPDGSLLAAGANPAKGTHKLVISTAMKRITALRLEALPDPSLAASGPGRAANGNFVLSEFRLERAAGPESESGEAIELRDPTATFEQEGWPVAATLDGNNDTGWAVMPRFGQRHTAIFVLKQPLASESGATLIVTLDHRSVHPQHVLGRFRLSATSADAPAPGPTLPDGVAAALEAAPESRTEAQKAELAAYYRSIAPALAPVRRRIARLQAGLTPFPPTVAREAVGSIAVEVRRREGFAGEVTVSLEGFSSGRDDQTKAPKPIAANIEVRSVTLKPEEDLAVLTLKPAAKSEVGTRAVVARAEAKVGGHPVVQVSRSIPVTVLEKAPAPAPVSAPVAAGLEFAYYEGEWATIPDFAALSAVKTGTAAGFDLAVRNRDTQYGLKFSGFLEVPRDGMYTFFTHSDDGSRLTIGQTIVVDNDGLHPPQEKSGKIRLKAGRHPIQVVFIQGEGGHLLEVFWQGPQINKGEIPASALSRIKSGS